MSIHPYLPYLWCVNRTSTPMTHSVVRRPQGGLYVRITDREWTRYVALGIKVPVSAWNTKQRRIRAGVRRAPQINARIAGILHELDEELLGERSLETAVAVARRIVRGDARDFTSYLRTLAGAYATRGQEGTASGMRASVGHLERFARRRLEARDMTPVLVEALNTYLHTKLAPNTVARVLKSLRTLCRTAIREGVLADDPFRLIRISEVPGEKVRLTLDELQRVASVGLPVGWPTLSRDLWMLAVYLAGARIGDIVPLTHENIRGDRVEYLTQKSGKKISIPIVPPAREIIDRYAGQSEYLLPILRNGRKRYKQGAAHAIVNRHLKTVAKAADVPPLTFHAARHTFADLARREGWSVYDISKALGHSSIRTTERYLAGFDLDGVDAGLKDLFG